MAAIDIFPLTSTNPSSPGGTRVMFKVHNDSDQSLDLQWIDPSGKTVSYGTVPAHSSRMQDSSTGHVWQLTGPDGKVGFKFVANTSAILTIGADYSQAVTDVSEKVLSIGGDLWSTAMGYGLINAAASLGIADTADLNVAGQNNYAALNAINAPAAWAAGYTGKGVKVAVVDSGIAAHPEINGRIAGGYDFVEKDSDPTPASGANQDHGLGLAGIIAGSHSVHAGRDTMGVAPDAQLLNVRVGSSQGSSSQAMADGIRWAVDNGAKVICMPLQSTSPEVDRLVADAVHYAYQHNVVTVLIGGNYSSFEPTGPATIARAFPGESIAVGNYDLVAGAPFQSSNLAGPTAFPWVMASSSGYVPKPDGGYGYHQDGGTSFAGPYVAGLAALLWEQNPNATAGEIIRKIVAGAELGNSAASVAVEVKATAGADVFRAAPGMHYDGAGGLDVLAYTGPISAYSVARNGDGSFDVKDLADKAVNHLVSIERIRFSDKTLALDVDGAGIAGQAYRLYQAAFARTPDAEGLGYWIGMMDAGQALSSVAAGFVDSAEFRQAYGANPSNREIVEKFYLNVLQRPGEQAGIAYWAGILDNHQGTLASVLVGFSESSENVAGLVGVMAAGVAFTPYG